MELLLHLLEVHGLRPKRPGDQAQVGEGPVIPHVSVADPDDLDALQAPLTVTLPSIPSSSATSLSFLSASLSRSPIPCPVMAETSTASTGPSSRFLSAI